MHFLLLASLALAKSLAGVSLPDASTVGTTPVVLNGIGLREKYFLDIYVGGLYLPSPSRDAAAIIAAEVPKRVEMHFVYREVSREQMLASFREDFGNQPGVGDKTQYVDRIVGWLPASVKRGDAMAFEYAPASGTAILLNGTTLGTIPGQDFMRLVFGVYLGSKPPTEALKAGLLGG
ncbi:MAG: chalcone isomerase family protein [Deltaproteobacteria bacterium]|nr:chalcone isomerase family protein [Deltaproteobacteria bacterium]